MLCWCWERFWPQTFPNSFTYLCYNYTNSTNCSSKMSSQGMVWITKSQETTRETLVLILYCVFFVLGIILWLMPGGELYHMIIFGPPFWDTVANCKIIFLKHKKCLIQTRKHCWEVSWQYRYSGATTQDLTRTNLEAFKVAFPFRLCITVQSKYV